MEPFRQIPNDFHPGRTEQIKRTTAQPAASDSCYRLRRFSAERVQSRPCHAGKPGQKCPGAVKLGVVDKLGGGAFFDKAAAVHEQDAVGNFAGKGDFVGNDDHGHLFGGKVADNF